MDMNVSMNTSAKVNNKQIEKRVEKQAAIGRVSSTFLTKVNNGQDAKTAFLESLSSIDQDTFFKQSCVAQQDKETLGTVQFDKAIVTPEATKKWLEVIAYAVPIIKSIIDLVSDIRPKKNPNSTIEIQPKQIENIEDPDIIPENKLAVVV